MSLPAIFDHGNSLLDTGDSLTLPSLVAGDYVVTVSNGVGYYPVPYAVDPDKATTYLEGLYGGHVLMWYILDSSATFSMTGPGGGWTGDVAWAVIRGADGHAVAGHSDVNGANAYFDSVSYSSPTGDALIVYPAGWQSESDITFSPSASLIESVTMSSRGGYTYSTGVGLWNAVSAYTPVALVPYVCDTLNSTQGVVSLAFYSNDIPAGDPNSGSNPSPVGCGQIPLG